MPNQPVHIFHSFEHLKSYVCHLPNWLANIIQGLGKSSIQYILPRYENSQIVSHIIAYIPDIDILKEVITEAKQPLLGFYSHQVIAQTNSPSIVSKSDKNNLLIHEIDQKIDKILPTLIDCSTPNKIVIKRPGPISKTDLELLTKNKIEITTDYFSDLNLSQIEIFRVNKLPITNSQTVILGTKEKLREIFQINSINHFKVLEIDNYFLVNLGSVTSPENIINQLSKNIGIAKNFGLPNIYFIENNWPNNNWGEILRFIFNNLTRKLPEEVLDQNINLNYLQNHKSFQLLQS